MDKLQPLIKYHFWVLFVPAFVMPPLAWWMTTADLQATIGERTDALDSSFSSISTGSNTANDDWIARAEDLIRIRKETNTRTVERLWEWQKSLVKWPPSVAASMDSCPYRGEITDSAIARRVPIDYRRNYSRDVRRVWLLSEPIGHETDPIPPNAPRKVWFPLSQMPQVPPEKWQNLPPSFIEIWNSQEDLWLLEQLMLAVQRTNSSANSISDSFVREIREVGLFGGTRVKPNEVSADASAASSASNPLMGTPTGFPGGGNRKTGRSIPTSARFDLEQEYKVKGLTSVTSRSSGSSGRSAMMMLESTGSDPGSANAADLNLDENRYIEVTDAYRTRGFHMVVTVHQQYVPDLVRELLDSQYPIDIIRMEQVARNPDEPDGSTESRPGGLAGTTSSSFGPAGVPTSTGIPFETEDPGAVDTPDYTVDPGDAFSEGEGEGESAAPITNSSVELALSELDLVELAIVGEMYLYNPPKPREDGDAEGAPDAASTPGAADSVASESPEPATPEPATPEPATPEPATPAPATPAPATPEPATPAPATPEPATPEPATPEPATPEPATPEPATPEPATPAPATPAPATPAPATPTTSSDSAG